MKYSVLGISLGILAVSVLVLGSFYIGFTPNAKAVNITDTATIDITVAGLTLVDMNPAEFIWAGIDPGTEGVRKQAQIENIGSTNFTNMWFNVTQPANRPFGTGSNDSYDAANMVWISREGNGVYYAVDRREFNETRSLIYLTDPSGNIPPDSSMYNYGRFRNTSYEYFWFYNKSQVGCGDFYVGDVAHSQGQTGSIDFSACDAGLGNAPGTNCREGATAAATGDANYCWADVNIGGDDYTVAIDDSVNGYTLRWSHWNVEFPGGRDWNEGAADHNDYFSTPIVYPGNSTVADLKIYVPYGVAKGKLTQGTLTVVVRSDPEAR